MTLFREESRLKEDWRILRIDDPKDFALFKDRKKYNFNGLVYKYPISSKMIKAAENFKPNFVAAKISTHYSLLTPLKLTRKGFPTALQKTTSRLRKFYIAARGYDVKSVYGQKMPIYVSLRSNWNSPSKERRHQHDPTMTMSIIGKGTLGFNQQGVSYEIPRGHIFLFDNDVEHSSPEPKKAKKTPSKKQRVTFVVTFPEIEL